jgi:hypothetical protein
MEEEVVVQTESLELSPEETAAIVDGTEPKEAARELPSETTEVDFTKYEGVSREDIIRQMEALQTPPKEEPPVEEQTPPNEENPPVPTGEITQEIFDEFAAKYEANGGKLTDEDYAALAEKGIDRKTVDERVDYEIYKNEKALKEGLAPYGDSSDIPDAVAWAKENWSIEQRKAFNEAVEAAEGVAQYAIVGGLLQQFAVAKTQGNGQPIHGKGNSPAPRVTGYTTKSDYVKDANSPAYDNDPSYRAQVEAKLAATDMNSWYSNVPKGV